MATIIAMDAQVKQDAERVAHNTTDVQLCMERTLPAMKKDLDQREAHLCSHAQVLIAKTVSLEAREISIGSKLDKMSKQLQELKRELDRGDSVIRSIQDLTKKSMTTSAD